jgi:bifunctional DNA-binding transcriptional regulator/antitoxin component of YhaV-PrlF toxin-antitoxin module
LYGAVIRFTLLKEGRMTKAAISSKGQIAIPKAVRERLNLKAGIAKQF